jgi:hypothetical protein
MDNAMSRNNVTGKGKEKEKEKERVGEWEKGKEGETARKEEKTKM